MSEDRTQDADEQNRRELIRRELRARRADRDFMKRLRTRLVEDRPILDRLA